MPASSHIVNLRSHPDRIQGYIYILQYDFKTLKYTESCKPYYLSRSRKRMLFQASVAQYEGLSTSRLEQYEWNVVRESAYMFAIKPRLTVARAAFHRTVARQLSRELLKFRQNSRKPSVQEIKRKTS